MKKLYLWAVITALSLPCFAQINNIEIRVGGDLWKLGYTASSSQINCGLCPQIIDIEPGAQSVIADLQDSVSTIWVYKSRNDRCGGCIYWLARIAGRDSGWAFDAKA